MTDYHEPTIRVFDVSDGAHPRVDPGWLEPHGDDLEGGYRWRVKSRPSSRATKVIYTDSFNGSHERACVVLDYAEATFGPSVKIKGREPYAVSFWVPPYALRLEVSDVD